MFQKVYQDLKKTTISEVNKGDQLQTLLETKIGLGKLNQLYEDFTVKDNQEKVCYQIGKLLWL